MDELDVEANVAAVTVRYRPSEREASAICLVCELRVLQNEPWTIPLLGPNESGDSGTGESTPTASARKVR